MEDAEFFRKLRQRGRTAIILSRLISSPRRYEQIGPWPLTLTYGIIALLYFLHVPNPILARIYRKTCARWKMVLRKRRLLACCGRQLAERRFVQLLGQRKRSRWAFGLFQKQIAVHASRHQAPRRSFFSRLWHSSWAAIEAKTRSKSIASRNPRVNPSQSKRTRSRRPTLP